MKYTIEFETKTPLDEGRIVASLKKLSKEPFVVSITTDNGQEKPISAPAEFVVEKVFKNRGGEEFVPLYFGDNYSKFVIVPNLKKHITIPEAMPKNLSEFVLPENMKDTPIQKETKSVPMKVEEFLLVKYLLIIKPELGKKLLGYEVAKDKYYIFHVELASGKVLAVRLRWLGDEWYCFGCDFDDDGPWGGGRVFLFFATA